MASPPRRSRADVDPVGGASSFGENMRARWAVRGLSRGSGSVRRVARTSQAFASVVGRSLATRALVRQPTLSWTPRREAIPARAASSVAPPGPSLLSVLMRVWSNVDATAEDADSASWPPPALVRALPSLARRSGSTSAHSVSAGAAGSAVRRAAPRPLGLPRVTLKGSRTTAGPMTGPTSGSTRLTPQQVGIRQPPEVAAVGRTLTPRDQGRAPRRANRAAQPNSAGRSHPGPAGPAGPTSRSLLAVVSRSLRPAAVDRGGDVDVTSRFPRAGGVGPTAVASAAVSSAAVASAAVARAAVPAAVRSSPLPGAAGRPPSQRARSESAAQSQPAGQAGLTGSFVARQLSSGASARMPAWRSARPGVATGRPSAFAPLPLERAGSQHRPAVGGIQTSFRTPAVSSPTSSTSAWISAVAPRASRLLVVRHFYRDDALHSSGDPAFVGTGQRDAARPQAVHSLPASRTTEPRPARREARPTLHDGSKRFVPASSAALARAISDNHVRRHAPTAVRRHGPAGAVPLASGHPRVVASRADSRLTTRADARPVARRADLRFDVPGSLARSAAVEMVFAGGASTGPSPVARANTGGLAALPGSPPMRGDFLPGRLMRRAADLAGDVRTDAFHPGTAPVRSRPVAPTGRGGRAQTAMRQVPNGENHSGVEWPAVTRPAHPRSPRVTDLRTRTAMSSTRPSPGNPLSSGRDGVIRQGGGPTVHDLPRPGFTARRATAGNSPTGAPGPAPTGGRPVVAPPGTTVLGRRFLGALAQRRADRDEPLPVQLRPLAELVVGARRAASVRLRTGPASAQALAQVGRAAATVDNVIHLSAPPGKSVRSAEVVAHELVHAARPSPVPRFFQDDHDTAEERQATMTGGLVRDLAAKTMERGGIASALQRRVEGSRGHKSSHLLFGTAGLTVAPGASPLTAGTMAEVVASGHRSSASAASAAATTGGRGPGRAAGATSAGQTATQAGASGGAPGSTGRSGASSAATGADASRTIHRRRAGARHRLDAPDAGLPPGLARLLDRPDNFSLPGADRDRRGPEEPFSDGFPGSLSGPSTRSGGPMSASFTPPPLVETSSHPISQETLDWIVEAVEERILTELERRGLRFQPGVF